MQQLKRKMLGVASAAVAVSTLVAVSAGPASAAGTDYTVTAGGSGDSVTATNVGNLTFEDTYNGPFGDPTDIPQMTCTALSTGGILNPGEHAFTTAPPVNDPAGQLTPASGGLSSCTNVTVGPVSATSSGTWRFGMATSTTTGGTGYVSTISLHLRWPFGGSAACDVDAAGSLRFSYDNSTGNLVFDPTYDGLTLSNATDTGFSVCETLGIYDDDPAALSGTVHLAPSPVIS